MNHIIVVCCVCHNSVVVISAHINAVHVTGSGIHRIYCSTIYFYTRMLRSEI